MPRMLLGLWIGLSAQAATFSYWVAPCEKPESGCHAGDPDLARWAMQAWQAASAEKLVLREVAKADTADIRLFWATEEQGLYGEARPVIQNGVRHVEVYVRPMIASGKDELLRDAIVYLTCLHESGHALGLPHTAEFDDIMYSFQYGGNIPEYFGRYRRKLSVRTDIRKFSGMSARDRERLTEIFH